jgi:omega-6 fatty acid desaturase (delta-12 desaturase)
MFLVGPAFQFMIKHRFPWNVPFSWKREWQSVHRTNLALAVILGIASLTMGLKNFLAIQIPVTLVSCSVGAWLFYIQHQYEDTYWENDKDWDYFDASIRGSSLYVLPKWLQWFTGNIGLHHIHHYNSRIPNYKLQQCYDENREFQNVTKLTLLSSLACIRLALWDETRKKLVGFGDVEKKAA